MIYINFFIGFALIGMYMLMHSPVWCGFAAVMSVLSFWAGISDEINEIPMEAWEESQAK